MKINPIITRRLFLAAVLAAFLTTLLLAQRNYAIYEVKSRYQTIAVWDNPDGLRRQLLFDPKWDGNDAIQSEMNKRDTNKLLLDYAQYMIASAPLVDKPKRILVVGLGGACIQRYLHNLLSNTIIETAELDPAMDARILSSRKISMTSSCSMPSAPHQFRICWPLRSS